MTVQATGARRLTLTRPALARDAFGAIESAGREALDELRRLLGVLRREDVESTLAPQPSLRHARSLARRTTAAGLPVALRVEGDERDLPAGLDVTAYRVIQDALGAALEHGGAGRAEVWVRFAPDTLEILVRDDGPAAEARPLMGIRERVVLHGGRLSAIPRRSGGHAVRATLPLDGRTVPAQEPAEDVPCVVTRGERLLRRLLGDRPRRAATDAGSRRPTAGALWRRLRRADVIDRTIAAAAAVAAVAEVLLSPDRSGPVVLNAVVALAYALPLAWRRRAPLAAAAVSSAAILTMALALTPVEHLFVPFVIVLAGAYANGAHRDGIAGLVLAVVTLFGVTATMDDRLVTDYVFPPLLGTVAWLAGRAVRTRTRLTAELHETAAQLAEASEDERRVAVIDERRRIAREMHDLVAHSMSVMVVQAGGARRILDRDPARALEAATMIERTGREALSEMRHLLGVLNLPEARAALAPQPTLAELGELIARSRAAGLPTVLDLRGERRPLPTGLDLAAYRIVQEALTNALKHAGHAPTTVTVEFGEHELALEIRDEGVGRTTSDGGHGLVGMRERVRLYGGEIETGPAEGGGWRVRATLPLGEVALI